MGREFAAGWSLIILLFLSACANPETKAIATAGLDLTVRVVAPLEVSLSWNPVAGSEGYDLERKSGEEAFVLLVSFADANANQTTYIDRAIEEGKTYTYRLTANVAGSPAESDEASVEVTPEAVEPPAPEAPPEDPTFPEPTLPTQDFVLSALTWAYANDATTTGEPSKDFSGNGGVLSVAGQDYSQGLGTQLSANLNSEIAYALNGNCTTFRAKVGIDDATSSQNPVVFQLFADGVKVWGSGVVNRGEAARETGDISVLEKAQLILLVRTDVSVTTPVAPQPEPTPQEPNPQEPNPDPTNPEPIPQPEPTPEPVPEPTPEPVEPPRPLDDLPVYANWLEGTLTCSSQPTLAAETFVKGSWGPVFEWQGLVATHLANLPDGRVLSWSSWDKTKQGGTQDDFKENTTGYVWNPLDNSFVEMNNPNHDMFCAGLAVLPNGDVFAGGGGNETNLYKTSVFEVANNAYAWRSGPQMVRDHWYGTAVALPSGGVVMSMGSDRGWNSTEVLADGTSTTETWDLLDGADTGPVMATIGTPTSDIPQPNDPTSSEYEVRGWYPYLSVAPNGNLFDAGPVPRLYEFDLTGEGSVTQVGSRNDQLRTWGTYVMYDEGKILVAGGAVIRGEGATNTAVTIDLSGESLEVTPAPDMAFQRAFQSAVMLPTGEALMVGGNTTGEQFTSEAAVLESEVWNPATNTWRTLAAEARPRTYHSAALLLPDGRVLAAGGGLCGRNGCAPGIDEPNGEIYSPPYLFNPDGTLAERPVISAAPERIGYSETFSVSVNGRDIQKFSLIKLSSITHGINTDLRYLSVPFVKGEDPNYTLTSFDNPNILTPGYYFLFAVDDKGVPSVSKTVLVAR
jgi:hypothetical protein